MFKANLKYLKFTIKKKERNAVLCKHCTLEITVGENYYIIGYEDGITKRFIGGLHEICIDDYKKEHTI